MEHLSEEERGHVENQLLEALEEALVQFEQATLSERQVARTRYLQAITDFTHFVAQYDPPGDEFSAGEIRQQVA